MRALFVSLRLQREVHDEIAAGRDYHLPLGNLLAEAESAALGYQLNLARAAGEARTIPTSPRWRIASAT